MELGQTGFPLHSDVPAQDVRTEYLSAMVSPAVQKQGFSQGGTHGL